MVIERLESRVMLAHAPFAPAGWVGALAARAGLHAAAAGPAGSAKGHRIRLDPFYAKEIFSGEEGKDAEPLPYEGTLGPEGPVLTGAAVEAIGFDSQAGTSGFYEIPPDSNVAAGPGHVIDVVNSVIEWRTKDGALQGRKRLGKNASTTSGSFFETLNPVDSLFDPKVVYDSYNGRFVVVALEMDDTALTSRILVAVSKTSDPNDGWNFGAINSKVTTGRRTTNWTDYPGLAVDSQAIYVTGNLFGFSGTQSSHGTRLWILPKTTFYAGGAMTSSIYDPATSSGLGGTTGFTLQPAQMYGTAPAGVGTFLVSSGYVSGSTDRLSVIRVNNPLASPTFTNTMIGLGDIHNSGAAFPGDVPQKGTSTTIEGGDQRVMNAVWRDGFLYAANSIDPPGGADAGQETAHWYKISTANLAALTLADQGNVGGEELGVGTRTFYPWVSVDSLGDVAMSFAAAGPNLYAGAYFAGRLAADAAGTMASPQTLAAGADYYVREFGGGRNRWGDYSGLALDPSDETTFWAFGEYAQQRGTVLSQYPSEDGRYGTRLAPFTLLPTPPTGSIAGVVYRDDDYSHARAPGEVGVAGVTIFVDANGNGLLDSGETSTVTDVAGAYSLANLAAGTYSIGVIIAGGGFVGTGPVTQTVPVATAAAVTGIDFGEFPVVLSGATTYALRTDAAGVRVEILVDGVFTYSAPKAALPGLSFATAGAGNGLTIDLGNGTPVPGGGVSYAASGAGNLTVLGSGGADVVALSPGAMTVNGAAVTFAGVGGVSVSTGEGDDSLTLNGVVPAFDLGTGADSLVLDSTSLIVSSDLGATSPGLAVTANGASTLVFAASQNLAALVVAGTSRVSMAADGNRVLALGTLSVAAGARLDLADNDMLVSAPPAGFDQTLRQYLADGRVFSSVAVAETGLGWRVDGGTALVKYTYRGDADLDGRVTGDDLALADRGATFGLAGWENGDFNYDGVIDAADFALQAAALGTQGPAL